MARRTKLFRLESLLLTIHENREEGTKEWAERLNLDEKFVRGAIEDATADNFLYRSEGELSLTEKGRSLAGLYCRPLLKVVA